MRSLWAWPIKVNRPLVLVTRIVEITYKISCILIPCILIHLELIHLGLQFRFDCSGLFLEIVVLRFCIVVLLLFFFLLFIIYYFYSCFICNVTFSSFLWECLYSGHPGLNCWINKLGYKFQLVHLTIILIMFKKTSGAGHNISYEMDNVVYSFQRPVLTCEHYFQNYNYTKALGHHYKPSIHTADLNYNHYWAP